jgi:hypothetical protein
VRDLELAGTIAEDERLAGELRVVADALVVEGLAVEAAMVRVAGSG